MSQKMLFPLLLICFTQLKWSSCDSLQEIVSDFQPKLQKLRYRVRAAAATSNIRLGIANAYISDRISISSSNVEQQLNSLQAAVQQAHDSSSSDEDLQVCLAAEQQSASAIDTDELSACRRNDEIAAFRGKVVLLKGLLAEIDQTVTACLVDAGVDTNALRECLQNSVDNIGVSLQEQESEIGRGIDDVIIGADQCASRVEGQLQETIAEIADDFLRCIGYSREEEDREAQGRGWSEENSDED